MPVARYPIPGERFDNLPDAPLAGPAAPSRFPLGLCAAQIVVTSLGLSAAALGIRWGAAPPLPPARGDALDLAWLYVNIMLLLGSLLVWPSIALSRFRNTPQLEPPLLPPPFARLLLWDIAALIIGALPALGVAAFVSATPQWPLETTLVLQAAMMLFALGVLSCCWGRGAWESAGAGLLGALALAGPVIVYFWLEFFPRAPDRWFVGVPPLALFRASSVTALSPELLWVAAAYAAVGLLLFILGARN
jgi:hypothetical protein